MEEHASHKKSSSSTFLIIGIAFIAIAVIIVLVFLLRGESTVTGNYPEPESSESITCEATNLSYPIIDPHGASRTTTKVTATFKRNILESIALVHSLYYDTADQINASLNINHPKLNLATQGEGLGPDIFNLHFNQLSDRLEFRLYTDASHIDLKSAKYLMLTEYPDNGIYTKSHIQTIYENQGYKCVANNQ